MILFNLAFGLLLCNVVAQSENYNVLSRTVVDQLQIQSDFSLPTKQVQLLDFRLVTGEGETIRCRGENFDTREIRLCGTSQYGFSVDTVGNGPDAKTTCTIFYEICRSPVSTGSRSRVFPAPGDRLMMWDRLRIPHIRNQRIPIKDRIFELQLSTAFYSQGLYSNGGLSSETPGCAASPVGNDNEYNKQLAKTATQEAAMSPEDSETVASFRRIVLQAIGEVKSQNAKSASYTAEGTMRNSEQDHGPASNDPSSVGVIGTGIMAAQSLATAESAFVFGLGTGFNHMIWKSVESAVTGFVHQVGESGFHKAFGSRGLNEKDVADAAAQEATMAIVQSFGQLAEAQEFVSRTDSVLLLSTVGEKDGVIETNLKPGTGESVASDMNPSKSALGPEVSESSEPSHPAKRPPATELADNANIETSQNKDDKQNSTGVIRVEVYNGFSHDIHDFLLIFKDINLEFSSPSISKLAKIDADSLRLPKRAKVVPFYFNFTLPDGSVCEPSYWFDRYDYHTLVADANFIDLSVEPGRWGLESISGWNETDTRISFKEARTQPGKLSCK